MATQNKLAPTPPGGVCLGMTQLKRTPLHAFHARNGGRLVEFAGWEMPVQYRSILEEHRAVRQRAGLFDVSHMGEVRVSGPGALAFLQYLVTNDVSRLSPGRILYSPMCLPNGGVVDDLLVLMRGPGEFLLCINAGNIDKDLAWIREHAATFEVQIEDQSEQTALLAIQGPRAAEIVQSLADTDLSKLAYYHFCEGRIAGMPCLFSRTGYTGEDGFEIYHAASEAENLAVRLLDAGKAHGLELAGLGARDSLRLEAGFPLYGHELSPTLSPLSAGIAWTVKLDKGCDFLGREALVLEKKQGSPRKVVFFRTGDRRIVRSGSPVLSSEGSQVGEVLSGTLSPMLNEAIGSALIGTPSLGSELHFDIRGSSIKLLPVKPPFVSLPPKVGAA